MCERADSRMAGTLLVLVLVGALQTTLCSPQPDVNGCVKWSNTGGEMCCEACYPGYRVFKKCGPRLKELCTPCESGTYSFNPSAQYCPMCTQCEGAQVQLTACTPTADTVCGCREGLACGDQRCSFCVDKCARGQEPNNDGSCRPCPNGTFSDETHQKCKPWSTKCPDPNQRIVAQGDAFTDIKCDYIPAPETVLKPEPKGNTEQTWTLVAPLIAGVVLVTFIVIIIIVTSVAKTKKKNPKKPIVRPPSDYPQTLLSTEIEFSFHEPEQEQGSSSESLDSKDSSDLLIGAQLRIS